MKTRHLLGGLAIAAIAFSQTACKPTDKGKAGGNSELAGDAAQKVYVAPGTHDEFYNIVSGGF
ncbi:MAG TPA: hypothetical protein VGE24_09870, partial [Emticicia sp.]